MEEGDERGASLPAIPVAALAGGRRCLRDVLPDAGGLLVVGHSDCATTRFVLPFAERLHERSRPRGRVALLLEDEERQARALAEEMRLELPVFIDPPPFAATRALGVRTAPTVFLIAAPGTVSRRWEGFQRAAFEEAAQALGLTGPFFGSDERVPALRPG